ncbi:MAG TPA: glycerate kinase [Marmoricola sp.]
MRVVIASDKWKGSLSSRAVGEHIAAGLRKAMPGARPNVLSVADGGDGSVDAALAAGFDQREMRVPDGRGAGYRCSTAWRGGDVVLEVAQLGGIARRSPDPLGASSHALGHALRIAAARGATRAFVGLGGSASTDDGAGMLQALGARLLDETGHPLPPGGGALARLATVDLEPITGIDGLEIVAARDVRNALLGPDGAAHVFGPQKGATARDVEVLEAGLTRWRDLTRIARGGDVSALAGSGAAGGIGYGLLLLGARIVNGADLFLDLIGFDEAVADADAVVTGEGRLDAQSLGGKLPTVIARRSRPRPVAAVVGSSALSAEQARQAGITDVTALDAVADPARALGDPEYTGRIVELLAQQLASRLAPPAGEVTTG